MPGVTDRSNKGLICCGTPIGTDDYVQEQCEEIIQKHKTLHHNTRKMDDTQSKHLLLRYCTCQNLNHWLRTVRPDLVEEAAKEFDQETVKTLQALLWETTEDDDEHVTLTEDQVSQARQHCQLGGLGLTSTLLVQPAAWLGSWSLTKKLVTENFKETQFHNILSTIQQNPHQSITIQSIADTHALLATAFRTAHKLIVPLEQIEGFGRRPGISMSI